MLLEDEQNVNLSYADGERLRVGFGHMVAGLVSGDVGVGGGPVGEDFVQNG